MTLVLEGVAAGYSLAPVLHDITCAVAPGSFTALLGLNGSGKSTLLKTVFGQLSPTAGTVSFEGHRIERLPTWKRVTAGIGYVPQGRDLFPELSVAENLELGAVTLRRDSTRVRRQRDLALELFPRLQQRLTQAAGSMSGGEQQMLALARGLMCDPTLMLLDEVSSGLSPKMTGEVAAALGRIKQTGTALLVIEHRPWLLEQHADHVLFLSRGTIAWSGGMTEALAEGRVHDFVLTGSINEPAGAPS